MEFEFKLEWDEIPEETRETKIDEIIEKRYYAGNYINTEYDGQTLAQLQENGAIRVDINKWISVHFPIYF